MSKPRLGVLLLALLASATWYATTQRNAPAPAAGAEPAAVAYNFEAQDVLLRQMDASGNLQYEVEAERIVQFPDTGRVQASNLTLRHDATGTASGAVTARNWVVTATEGELPADGRVVKLSGDVKADGVGAGSKAPLHIATRALDFDLVEEVVAAEGEVEVTGDWGRFRGRGLRVHVTTGDWTLEYDVHGTISP